MRVLILSIVVVAGCTNSTPHIKCTDSEQCSLPGRPGVCLDGSCAVADSGCPSGYRYDAAAGASGECVPPTVDPPDMAAMEHDMATADLATADMTEPPDMAQPVPDLAGFTCATMPEGAQCAVFICSDYTISTTTSDQTIIGHCQAGACMANGIAAIDPNCSPYKCYRSKLQNKYVCDTNCECDTIGMPCAPGHVCVNCPPGNSSGGMCV
jgi:hypothetical protein